MLSPTQLAQLLTERSHKTWSARRVNKVLVEQEFQQRNPQGNPDYLPTQKGRLYGQIVLNTAKGRDKTIQSLRWFREVLDAIEDIQQ